MGWLSWGMRSGLHSRSRERNEGSKYGGGPELEDIHVVIPAI